MADISFPEGHGAIFLELPANKLSLGVSNPGAKYMHAAHETLRAIQGTLADHGSLPNVEDVAYHLKKLLP